MYEYIEVSMREKGITKRKFQNDVHKQMKWL